MNLGSITPTEHFTELCYLDDDGDPSHFYPDMTYQRYSFKSCNYVGVKVLSVDVVAGAGVEIAFEDGTFMGIPWHRVVSFRYVKAEPDLAATIIQFPLKGQP